jgi:aminoglycoside phosphotransferase (APT) family kinase protein
VTTDFINESYIAFHRTFHTPESVVFQLVQASTGQTPVRRQRIVDGAQNEVYCVATVQDKEFIVRIRRSGYRTFGQEAWAMERCRAAGVPVPAILSLTTLSGEEGDLEAMVLSKAEGVSLADLRSKLDASTMGKLFIEAGAVLRKIHSVKAESFKQLHENGNWDFPDWESMMDSYIRDRTRRKNFILQAGFSPAEFDMMIKLMNDYKATFSGQAVLNHGDYFPEHIFVKDGRISSVIDFGIFHLAPPLHDFAEICAQEPSLDLKPLLRGYLNESPADDRFTASLTMCQPELQMESLMHKMNLCQVGLQMEGLAHKIRCGKIEEAERLGKRLRKTLQDLRSNPLEDRF